MEPVPNESRHTRSEVANHYSCQRLVKSWQDRKVPSSQAIPRLHSTLMNGSPDYQRKGLVPLLPGQFRTTNVMAVGRADNFFAQSLDVAPAMLKFSQELDVVLEREPISSQSKLEETIHDASWAYFTFVRIHPFLDGNGRVGRMILKRVVSARGFKDIIFQTNDAKGKNRDAHVAAMNAASDTGNLAHLEIWLLDQFRLRYAGDASMLAQIRRVIEVKKREIDYQSQRRNIASIWEGFRGMSIDGAQVSAGSAWQL